MAATGYHVAMPSSSPLHTHRDKRRMRLPIGFGCLLIALSLLLLPTGRALAATSAQQSHLNDNQIEVVEIQAPEPYTGKSPLSESFYQSLVGYKDRAIEVYKQRQQITDDWSAKLKAKDFSALSKEAERLRAHDAYFADGKSYQQTFYETLQNAIYVIPEHEYYAGLESWRYEFPRDPTPDILFARWYFENAEQARGTAYIAKVTKSQYEDYSAWNQRALDVLKKTLKAHRNLSDPYAYEALILASVSQPDAIKRISDAFLRGVKQRPDALNLYTTYANFTQPKWFGRPGAMEGFAEWAAQKTAQQWGDWVYTLVATVAARTNLPEVYRGLYQFDWPRIAKGYADRHQRYPLNHYEVSQLCWFAVTYGDRPTTRRLLSIMNGNWSRFVWRNEENFRRAEQWANESP